jgi:hypothetical protein
MNTAKSVLLPQQLLHIDYRSESLNLLVIRGKNDGVGGSCSMHSKEAYKMLEGKSKLNYLGDLS